ncbi:MAG TPA: outer membrane beta-barrel domain-containing protein [Planctomycetota bacterium]|jgi:outer membrane beta-barrel protein|nr:outer membrane beta-barrel domain-containing protein [Planctomycetota bacterium]
MMRALAVVASLLAFAPLARAASQEEEAGDVSEVDKDALGPLRERIPPVSGNLFLKKHRFELSPSIATSLKDAFYTKYVFGLSAAYHVTETIAINGRFGYSVPTVSGAAQICVPAGVPGVPPGCSQPSMDTLLGVAPGAITLLGGADLEWAPLYGKIALVSETFAHFDIYGILGATAVQYTGPRAQGASTGGSPTFTGGANVGLGMRFFLNRWLAIRAELRDVIYSESVNVPTPNQSSLRNQLFFELGFSMFFPTAFSET